MDDPMPIRIVLAEDSSIIRQGLRYIIDAQPDMTVFGEAADGEEVLRTTIQITPDLVLMDIRMPKRNGIEATRAILEALPETRVILLTTFDIQEYVFDGIRAGAVGYVLKDAETSVLLEGYAQLTRERSFTAVPHRARFLPKQRSYDDAFRLLVKINHQTPLNHSNHSLNISARQLR